jgi:hypothetical protein
MNSQTAIFLRSSLVLVVVSTGIAIILFLLAALLYGSGVGKIDGSGGFCRSREERIANDIAITSSAYVANEWNWSAMDWQIP